MFEQSIVEATGKTQRGWPVAASLTLQSSLVGVALLMPLLHPEILPGTAWATLPLAAPPPPPPARTQAASVTKPVMRTVRSLIDGTRLLQPRAIPQKVAMIDDGDIAAVQAGVQGGVQGGIEGGVPDGAVRAVISAAQPPPTPPVLHEEPVAKPKEPIRVRRGGEVQEAMLVHRVIPAYPPLARQARIEGRVVFRAVISAQGLIRSLELVSGHPLLVEPAREAVRQWRYRPTLLNGEPCEVDTVIEVNFTLQR